MPLPTPETPSQVEEDCKVDVQRSLVSANPFLPNSWIGALISGFANRLFDNYQNTNRAVDEAFYDTSTEEFLTRQASWYSIFRLDPSQGSGDIIIGGNDGEVLSSGDTLVSSDGISFSVDSDITIALQQVNVLSITPNGTIATVVCDGEHNLSSRISPTISGADPVTQGDLYNVINAEINVISPTEFTYQLSTVTAEAATGTIVVSSFSARGSVTAVDFGADTNLDPLAPLTISPNVSGINPEASVSADGFAGGADREALEDFRARLLRRVRNPVSNFNVGAIENKLFETQGITRVFVFEVTPNIGDVTVYFMRDNDSSPIPNAQAVSDAKNSLLEIKPANTPDSSVIVEAPVGVAINFGFASLVPNTPTMRDSIIGQLEEFFKTRTEVGENINEDAYRTAIFNTVDTTTGDPIESFELNAPSGDIIINNDEIGILGTVDYP